MYSWPIEARCTFVLHASPWLASPRPFLYGGAIALLAEAALASGSSMLLPGRPWSDVAGIADREAPAPG